MKKIGIIICLTIITFIGWHLSCRVTRFDIPKGELKWSPVKPINAKMCIPAAFTHEDGKISGSYRCNGKNYQNGKSLNMRVSLNNTSLKI